MYKPTLFIVSVVLVLAMSFSQHAQTQSSVALAGRVSSAQESAMEGVLVSAKKAGSTITITVVTDEQGRYRFPSTKLQPGHYALRIRAVAYDLEGPREIDVTAGQTTTADLKLTK